MMNKLRNLFKNEPVDQQTKYSEELFKSIRNLKILERNYQMFLSDKSKTDEIRNQIKEEKDKIREILAKSKGLTEEQRKDAVRIKQSLMRQLGLREDDLNGA